MEGAVWRLIGTIVGAIASVGTSWVATRAAASAQREKLLLEWRVKHCEFQIRTATELQEVFGEFVRATGRIRHVDEMRAAGGQTGEPTPVGEDLSDGFSDKLRRINALLGRIDNAEVVRLVSEAKKVAVSISIGVGIDTRTMMSFANAAEAAQTAISSYLRAVYANGPEGHKLCR